jgi:hypothetical protein
MLQWKQWEDNMATQAERLAVVETKVEGLSEKVDDLKVTVNDTKMSLTGKLDEMYAASCSQHANLAEKLNQVEKFKDKWIYTIMGALAVLGWVTGHFDIITKFLN